MHKFKIYAASSVFLCFTVTVTLVSTVKAQNFDEAHFCQNTTTFSPNSTYQTNLNKLLSWLSSNSSTSKNGFYNTTVGVNGDTVYGAFLCRGDLNTDACQNCVSAAAKQVLEKCPVEKESVIWYTECTLHYSNQNFFSTDDEVPMSFLQNSGNVSEQSRFMQILSQTINTAAAEAANGGDFKKFGTKETDFSSFQKLYTLAQCTPDLSALSCERCLDGAIANLPMCCNGKQGGRVLLPSCNIRYELYPFYRQVTVPSPQQPTPKAKGTLIVYSTLSTAFRFFP